MREVDAIENEKQIINEKVNEKHEQVDDKPRNFFSRGVGASTIKYVHDFNHLEMRNNDLNKDLVQNSCP